MRSPFLARNEIRMERDFPLLSEEDKGVQMSTERDDSLVDNNTADVVDDTANLETETDVDTNVVSTDVYGPSQRDRTQAWQDDSFADLSLARKRDESAAEGEREQTRRHAEEMFSQRQRHVEELFDSRKRLIDLLTAISVQDVAASGVDTTVSDTALVGELVSIIDKITTTSPPANTGTASK